MRWYVKQIKNDEDHISIAYSYEKNDSCDGRLTYDKATTSISIENLSEGADDFATRWLFSHIHGLIRRNELTDKKKMIAIG